jgi:dihydropteroate synthase
MTKIIGILNITPDSFSDAGKFAEADSALKRVEQMLGQGASVIDIGAESTRPDATLLGYEEEFSRLNSVLPILCTQFPKTTFSLDTRNPQIAVWGLNLGVDWINDVAGFSDPSMIEVARDYEAKIVVMHNLTVPADPEVTVPENEDVLLVVKDWFRNKIDLLQQAGIKRENIILDVGIGFGKTAVQSWQLITWADEFKEFGLPLLYGHSEKSFLKLVTEKPAGERTIETASISAYLTAKKVDFLRVHDVETNYRAIKTCKMLFGD